MIPYFEIVSFNIGPLTVYVWGLLVAAGFLTAALMAQTIIERRGLKGETMISLAVWIIIGSMIGARLVHAAAYDPARFMADPWDFFRIWHGGLSSVGGFIGAAAAAFLFVWIRKIPIAPYADAALRASPWGWAIGRIGCFLIHDHPGILTNSILGVRYPGGSRYDLGLIEILNAIGMGLVIAVARRFYKRDLTATMFGVAWYAVVRFFTDFLRATDLPNSDIRYAGLTPAQYAMIPLLVVALVVFFPSLRGPRLGGGRSNPDVILS